MATRMLRIEDKVVGNDMDLSLQSIVEVPLREMALYRRISTLDLSNNHIRLLPDDFPQAMFQLQKLDLSRNLIIKLPEAFGQLAQLRHLDLYRNKLERLPMSISRMGKLRWLDVKENPLVEALAKICGECLDTIQCQQCAKHVVFFMRQVEQQCIMEKSSRQNSVNNESTEAPAVIDPPKPTLKIIGSPKRKNKKSAKVQEKAIDLSLEEVLRIEEIHDENNGLETCSGQVQGEEDYSDLSVSKKKSSRSRAGKNKFDAKCISPRSRTGIHTGIKTFNANFGAAPPPQPRWSWLSLFYKILRVLISIGILVFSLALILALVVDYRLIQTRFPRWLSYVLPDFYIRGIASFQLWFKSFFAMPNGFPFFEYVEQYMIVEALNWVCETICASFFSFFGLFPR